MRSRFASLLIRAAILPAVFIGGLYASPALSTEGAAKGAVEYVEGAKKTSAVDKEMDLLESIARRQKELDEREAALQASEERLNAIKKDIDKRLEELNRVHDRIEAFSAKIDDATGERMKKLARIYVSMSPEDAASRLEKLDEKTAVMILANVKEKSAAKILSFVNVQKAVRLSQLLKIEDTNIEQQSN